ncbi:hypothetical protein HK098_000036 [Nowakowskiella sp. JEL0407]|nr:hypothetical protein HK098_000036 [Nowakowskiella sp. JEL0407]
MDNEPVQNSILSFGALKTLTGIIKKAKVENVPEYTGMALSALSVLSNLAEADQGVPGLLQSDSFELLFNLLKNEHDSILDESLEDEKYFNSLEFIDSITTLLETIGENDDVQRSIVTKNFLDVLLNFVDHKPKFRAQEADEDSYSFEEIRKTVSRIVTLVTMNDVNMVEITKKPELIARFKQWLTLGTDSDSGVKEDEIRMSGALSIGNLARSDETCISLVQEYGIAQSLLELAVLEKDRVLNCEGRDDKKSAIKVLHAVFGALKNLSLTNENRSPLGKIGLISVCADILELDTLKSIHHPCVGIMKNLCGDNLDNVYRALTGYEPSMKGSFSFKRGSKTPLSQLIASIWKSTGENDIVLRNEGGRVIVNMVRVCGHQREANHLLNALIDFNVVTPLVQIVTGALLTRSNDSESPEESAPPNHGQEETEHHVHFDAVPLDGQFFPIVQNEGIVALIMLLNFKPELVSRVTRYHHSLSPTIMKILASGVIDNVDAIEAESDVKFVDPASDKPQEYNDKIKVNTCMLLTALLHKDESFKTKIAPKLKIVLRALLSKVREHPADESPSRPTSSRPQRFGPVDRTSTKSAKPMLLENSKKEMNASMNFGEEITADGTPSPISLSEAIGIVLLML